MGPFHNMISLVREGQAIEMMMRSGLRKRRHQGAVNQMRQARVKMMMRWGRF
jgi:hypothetical protein